MLTIFVSFEGNDGLSMLDTEDPILASGEAAYSVLEFMPHRSIERLFSLNQYPRQNSIIFPCSGGCLN